MERINEYAPVLTDAAINEYGGGFTVLAHTEAEALKIILQSINENDFTEIELFGSRCLWHWETQEFLKTQNN
jgi:hypothetical protein